MKWNNGAMPSLPILALLGFAVVLSAALCTLAWSKHRRRRAVSVSSYVLTPRKAMRSQVIVVSQHEAPTREFAAHLEELAQLSTNERPTRAIAVERFSAGGQASSQDDEDTQPSTGPVRSRRDEDETLKVVRDTSDPSGPEDLIRMLGPKPTPNLSNIEIYYRLGLTYLASGLDAQARHCFLTVDEISPGYRDVEAHLAQLPMLSAAHRPTGPYHVPTVSGFVPKHSPGAAPKEREPTFGGRRRG